MLEVILDDIANALASAVNDNSLTTLGILGAVALFSGLRMSSPGELFGKTGQGLILFAVVLLLFNGLVSPDRTSPAHWHQTALNGWHDLMGLEGQTLIGYGALFALALIAIYAIKLIARR